MEIRHNLIAEIKTEIPNYPALQQALDAGDLSSLAYIKAYQHQLVTSARGSRDALHVAMVDSLVNSLERETIALALDQSPIETSALR